MSSKLKKKKKVYFQQTEGAPTIDQGTVPRVSPQPGAGHPTPPGTRTNRRREAIKYVSYPDVGISGHAKSCWPM